MAETIVVKINLVLHDGQRRIHASPAKFKVCKAGKRFGKTKWALFEICQIAARERNKTFWMIAPTYRQAKQIAWAQLKWLIPNDIVERRVETDLLIEFKSGSTLQLIGADNDDSLRGIKLHGVIFDECAYIDEYVWPLIRGQLLGSNGEESGFAYFISSPNKKGRNWFTNFHAEAQKKESMGDKDWAAFYFTIHDNPTLDPGEVQKMKDDTPDETWQLEYLAIESQYAGVLYSEFTSDKNIGEPKDPYSKSLLHYRGIDWGIDHPTVCLWASLDPSEKIVYITDEFVRSDLVISESADMIKTRTGDKPIEWTVIDPSTGKRNSQTGRSDALEFNRSGIPTIMADNRERGYDVTKMFLKKARIKVSPKCKTLIYALKNVQRGEDEGDDTTDALRYIILRIHDNISGMNIFEMEGSGYTPSSPESHEINIYDPIFAETKPKNNIQEWLKSQTAA
jgi:hypothetical protein